MAWLVIINGNQLTSEQRIKEIIMSAAQDVIDRVTAQLSKAKTEIIAAIDDLKAQNADVDTSALEAAAQSLDDVIPDAPVDEPDE